MRKTKTQNGITLVALIITIIILLILAVVAIRSITGDGILQKAREAADATARGQIQEELDLAISNLKMEETIRKNMSQQEKAEWLRQELNKQDGNATVVESGNGFIGNYKDHNFSINEDYKVTIGDYAQNDNNNSNDNNNDNSSNEQEPETMPQITVGTIAEQNSTINGELYSNRNPIIPAGFMAVNIEGEAEWDAEGGPQVDNGLVISEGTNEFVWVPVISTIQAYGLGTTGYREPDVVTDYDNNSEYLNIINNILGTNYKNSDNLKTALTEDFNEMTTSVNEYGGFYVGRYETSINNGKAQSVKNATSARASSSSANTWYGLYALCKTYNTNFVKSSMIWGSQYNAMMTWIGSAANTNIGDNRNKTRKTGSVETDKIKNVYDLYGNSSEWTLQANGTSFRVCRGGDYLSDDTPSIHGITTPTHANSLNGSRLTLYIV